MASALFAGHKKSYDLQAYVIMPDHVHLLLKPIKDGSLSEIMKTIKGSTAYQINQLLNRTGKFWQTENFDRLIRHSIELREKWEYIKENPVVAKLVRSAEEYPYSSFYSPK